MNTADDEILKKTRGVIALQLCLTVVLAGGLLMAKGNGAAASAAYGGLVNMVSTLLLSRSVVRMGELAADDSKKGMVVLYVGAVQRFLVVLALFGAGLALLKMQPVPMIAGFGVALLAYVAGMRR